MNVWQLLSDLKQGSAGPHLLRIWTQLNRFPGGNRVFNQAIARLVPYSGTISPQIEALAPGQATVHLRDRRAHQNHLGSIHAIALANLGELATGLAFATRLPANARAILVNFNIEYLKKARGRIRATCAVPRLGETELVPESVHPIEVELRDARDEVVARVSARWRVRFAGG